MELLKGLVSGCCGEALPCLEVPGKKTFAARTATCRLLLLLGGRRWAMVLRCAAVLSGRWSERDSQVINLAAQKESRMLPDLVERSEADRVDIECGGEWE